ncbi:alpha-amylase family protein [Streptomyces fulvoviolaceus]|uniref:hypothetical protein n=1 Tax=Streptomyces fulvoviolaceus TaxID=285535 RepID=UPI0036F22978
MRSSSYSAMPARALRALVVLALTAAAAPVAHADSGTEASLATKPYMGWSSWSMQSSKYPGLNPDGDYSYLTEANVLKQTDAMAAKLKKYGYEYVNIDAGWWRDTTWKPAFDEYGRQKADPVRFPSGMKAVADRIHAKGLKAGIYLPAGLEKEAYGGGRTPIWNADGCTTADIVYDDLRTINGRTLAQRSTPRSGGEWHCQLSGQKTGRSPLKLPCPTTWLADLPPDGREVTPAETR